MNILKMEIISFLALPNVLKTSYGASQIHSPERRAVQKLLEEVMGREREYIRVGNLARLRAALSILGEIKTHESSITKDELREIINKIEVIDKRLCDEDYAQWQAGLLERERDGGSESMTTKERAKEVLSKIMGGMYSGDDDNYALGHIEQAITAAIEETVREKDRQWSEALKHCPNCGAERKVSGVWISEGLNSAELRPVSACPYCPMVQEAH